jgi:hypothetical protein
LKDSNLYRKYSNTNCGLAPQGNCRATGEKKR